jgi:DNA primase
LPVSRADHAARLLLGGMTMLDRLSAEDHTMLCELPAPHGPLFVWLEGQLHEHGTQSWMTLREGLRGHPDEELALRLMSDHEMDGATSADSSFAELRDLLDRMLIERLKSQETEAIQRADTDPSALKHYRELQTRRRQIEAMLGTIRH